MVAIHSGDGKRYFFNLMTIRQLTCGAIGWDRWLGEHGGFVGMTGFGASGPAAVLYPHVGITPEAIVAEARRLLTARRGTATA